MCANQRLFAHTDLCIYGGNLSSAVIGEALACLSANFDGRRLALQVLIEAAVGFLASPDRGLLSEASDLRQGNKSGAALGAHGHRGGLAAVVVVRAIGYCAITNYWLSTHGFFPFGISNKNE